jgi:hypothetical protein
LNTELVRIPAEVPALPTPAVAEFFKASISNAHTRTALKETQ